MNIINRSIKALVLLFVMSSTSVFATEQIHTGYFNNKAVSGYDVIAYFEQAKPVEGSSKYQLEYKGADWYFSSQANLDKFKANPEKFAPQYGGYCAWAMSNDKAAPGNPPFWTIYNDKLYLNYDQNVLDTWRADKDGFIKSADAHWAKTEKE
ncbi:YHS domain-containing (seleno)protein [Psychromonas sp. Urea-02u-13]|uniref:YHS domain-containing (seleno)protein n=1 Tax=Psychromonas sp. Urea-02u-13 TaxID=2058326 RepID=UPI000C342BFB|nr:YHS domain-containing (seleno)protein [Psychromonas sp. Urea-02u-13]PKG39159.1 YHS domain protein [Psychromonas sp. Urea-02u-13]